MEYLRHPAKSDELVVLQYLREKIDYVNNMSMNEMKDKGLDLESVIVLQTTAEHSLENKRATSFGDFSEIHLAAPFSSEYFEASEEQLKVLNG